MLDFAKFLVEESTKEIVRKAAAAVGSLRETEFDVKFNPDVFSPGVQHPDPNGPDLKKACQRCCGLFINYPTPYFCT
jgi:hypothetical protein